MTSINIVEAKAIDNGIYIAPVLVDYRNPETGLIEDGGSEENYDLGLGMCNSIVGSQALIEVENGKKYITLRFSLMSNISNVSIGVQSSSRGTYHNVSPEVTKSGGDWKDYRFQVTDENLYISPTMYVTPMQRNVKFFIKINSSAATAGVISFIALIVPHIARLIIGSDYKLLIPFSCILGAFTLLFADTIGRSIFAPYEVPASIIMAIIGGPFLIILLRRSTRSYGN